MSFTGVPGAKGQPTETGLKGPSMETLSWAIDPTPKVDYAMGNPLQETSPAEMKPQTTNDTQTMDMGTANEINGGRDMFDGGGIG